MELDRQLYPFRQHYFQHEHGFRQHYLDEGEGPVLLMVHGNPTWSFYYRNVVQALSKSYRCIVPDHIGCGFSDKPNAQAYPYSLKNRIEDLQALMDHLNIDGPVSLLLHDWGGAIGMGWAVENSDQVSRIALLNTAAFTIPPEKKLPKTLALVRNSSFGAWLVNHLNAFAAGASYIGFKKPVSKAVRQGYVAPYDSPENRVATLRFVQDIPLSESDPAYKTLAQIEQKLPLFDTRPVQIFWGLKDFVFDRIILNHWQKIWPQAEVSAYEDCGHYVLEDAKDRIIPDLEQFLSPEKKTAEKSKLQQGGNIARHLSLQAATDPDKLAIAVPDGRDGEGAYRYHRMSYAQLEQDSHVLALGLRKTGIKKGLRVALMVTPGIEFFKLTFALFRMGAVPVLIDPGIGVKNMKACLKEAEPEAFIGIPKAHIARILMGWAKTAKITLSTRAIPGLAKYHLKGVEKLGYESLSELNASSDAQVNDSDMAAILFTSGSTGVPKGVVYQHAQFNAQVALLKRLYNIQAGEIDLPTFPLFALFAPALGMTCIIPDMNPTRPADADPQNILDAISDFSVTNVFASPALLKNLGSYIEKNNIQLPSIKRVISAGATVPPDVLKRVQNALSEERAVVTPYGATECLPVSSINAFELAETEASTKSGAGVCVGKPLEENQVEIIHISDEAISEWSNTLRVESGAIGEIVVCGPSTTQSYFNREQATQKAKIKGPNNQVYHRMGDVGYMDTQGRLWFCGRMTQRVETESGPMFTDQCESVFNAMQGIGRTALIGLGEKGQQEPVLIVERSSMRTNMSEPELASALLHHARSHALTRNIERFLFYKDFPVDIRHNAKIRREILREWAAKQK